MLGRILLQLFSRGVVSDSFVTPWTVALQAPLSMGFPGKNAGNGLLFPCPEKPPDSGIKPMSPPLAGRLFITELPGKPIANNLNVY